MKTEKNNVNNEKTYSPNLTESQLKLVEKLLGNYCKKTEVEINEVDRIPDGPCFPPREGTANPWAKEAVKALLYHGGLKDAYGVLKEIERVRTAR